MPLLLGALGLAACASSSHAVVSADAGAATPEIQSLARRAARGDKVARLELGIRYEEGRGVGRDPERARRLYLSSLEGPRLQTAYVPAKGAVAPQNAAIGRVQAIWPRSFGEIRGYHPTRIAAVLRLCGLGPRPGRDPECRPEEAAMLRHLAQFETHFRACRIRTNLGNAASTGPYSFIFNAVDTGRRIETRRCMLGEALPETISRDQSQRIWAMWAALSRAAGGGDSGPGSRDEIRRQFTRELATYREDSLMWFAMRDALGRNPSPEDQVGDSWWWHLCNLASPAEPRITATDTETKICALIAALAKKE